MAVPRSTRWELAPHTRTKHDILRRYLNAWLPIMAMTNGRIVFIDGFAGPGRYSGGEPGSPLIALRSLLDHHHFRETLPGREVVFIFIEKEHDRTEALRSEVAGFDMPGWVKVQIYEGDFAEHMESLLAVIDEGGQRLAPTFAFLDPFGFKGIPLHLIARIVSYPKCECLINFSYESINRFLSHPEQTIQADFDELFGTSAWRDVGSEREPRARRDRLAELYRRQLRDVARLRFVRLFEMVDEGNKTEYFLFFGTNSSRGLSKMKEAMWGADPMLGRVFRDRTSEGQMTLFQPGAETGLREELQRRLAAAGWVRIDEIERFVLEDTAYSETKHLRRQTLAPMERVTPPLIEVKRPAGKRSRAGEYPRGTVIRFARPLTSRF